MPQPIYQAPPPITYRPQMETQYRVQPMVTYQDVPQTQYRRETYVENVPVTTYRQVLVPQTVMQPQTRCRDVAYQTTVRVPRTVNQVVPTQTVRMVPEVSPCGGGAPMMGAYPGYAPQAAFGGPFANPGMMTATAPFADYGMLGVPQFGAAPPQQAPQMGIAPYNPGTRVAVPPGVDAVPTQSSSNGSEWAPIPQRTAGDDGPGVSYNRSLVPSAAIITQSRFGQYR